MKIAALLDQKITSGGGFNQALNAVVQMNRLVSGKYDFVVFTTIQENVEYLARIGIVSKYYQSETNGGVASRLLSKASRWLAKYKRGVSSLEKMLLQEGVDLVYFVTPTAPLCNLKRLNYIATVWDLCHRDAPEFPEVREFGEFYRRESLYKSHLAPAIVILVDSEILAKNISEKYGIDHSRLLAMPFEPAPFVTEHHSESMQSVLKKNQLEKGYYFYPAQFWAHKNHIRIIEALAILKKLGCARQVVFAGADQGNLTHIKKVVESLGLNDYVRFLGFVPVEDMKGLYEGCGAVVMPTYFGPTNLPPLEAWSIGKPLIYSSYFVDQTNDAALLVDPDNENELAEAMRHVIDNNVADSLIRLGHARLLAISELRLSAENRLLSLLQQFEKRRACWS